MSRILFQARFLMVSPFPFRNRLFVCFVNKYLLILWVAVCWPITSVRAQSQLGHQALSFTLIDQFGHQTTLRFPQPTPIAILFSDRHSRSLAGPWVEALSAASMPLRTMTIACIGWIPTMLQPMLRKAFSQSKPVLLDWNDTTAKQYGYSGGFLLVLITPAGQIIATENTAYSSARLTALSRLSP